MCAFVQTCVYLIPDKGRLVGSGSQPSATCAVSEKLLELLRYFGKLTVAVRDAVFSLLD